MRIVPYCLTVFLAAAAGAAPLPDDALADDAGRKIEAGDFDGALAVLARAEKAAPKDPRARYLRGVALSRKHDVAGATKAFREALALDPKLGAVHNELGVLLDEAGRSDEALVEFKAAAAAQPELGEAWSNLGRAEMKRGDAKAAVESYKKGLPYAAKDADLRIDLSAALRKLERHDESTAMAREAVALAPGEAPAHLNLGLSLLSARKLDEAQVEVTAATRLDPKGFLGWWTLGTIERDRKKWDAALAALDRAWALKPAPAVLVDRAETLRKKGDLGKAEALLRDGTAKSPRSLALRIELVRTLAAAKKCKEAGAALGPLPAGKDEVAAVARELKAACP